MYPCSKKYKIFGSAIVVNNSYSFGVALSMKLRKKQKFGYL